MINYDNITLLPDQVSIIKHRSNCDTSVQFGPVKLDVPIIAAPMLDVCDRDMAIHLYKKGSFGITHRFGRVEDQISTLNYPIGYAVGVDDTNNSRLHYLMERGAKIFCIDTANGANQRVFDLIKHIKWARADAFVIAGNVANNETFWKLAYAGADAIRVGIAGGSVCETRTETGIYAPTAWSINDITHHMDQPPLRTIIREKFFNRSPVHVPLIIADAGIRTPSDMCKALALGADVVMVGSLFAGTDEAPGQIVDIGGQPKKLLRGSASHSVQLTNGRNPLYIEGRETWVDYKGSVDDVLIRFKHGLQSSMSYCNARDLVEYQSKVRIERLN